MITAAKGATAVEESKTLEMNDNKKNDAKVAVQ